MTTSRRIRILYIEKDSSNRLLLKLVLRAHWNKEYELLEAENGLSGVVKARQELPDLILLDILLPGMDGYEVAARLKSLPALRDTPVVALTSLAGPGDRARALAAGCAGYIQKPINMKTLASELREFLEGKRETISVEEERQYLREHTGRFARRLEDQFIELAQAQEELRESEGLISKFLALSAHELRTPVTIIQGYLGIMLDAARQGRSLGTAEALSATSGLDKGVQRLSNIVNDILDVVRIEANTLQLHPAEVSVGETVRSVADDFRVVLEERQQRLSVDSLDGLPRVWVDGQRIYQVFTNIVGNAIKYTPDGGQIRISGGIVSVDSIPFHPKFTPLSTDYVDVTVQDSGVGVAEEDTERIFRSFYEVRDVAFHSTSKDQFLGGGIGLGLVIARGIMRKHGGWLWAESAGSDLEKCPGSCFHVLMPIRSPRSLRS